LKSIQKVLKELQRMLKTHSEIDQQQTQQVFLEKFKGSTLDIIISAYTLSIDNLSYMEIKQDLLLKIADILEAHDVKLDSPLVYVEIPSGLRITEEE
jgi:MscS family membrane protein